MKEGFSLSLRFLIIVLLLLVALFVGFLLNHFMVFPAPSASPTAPPLDVKTLEESVSQLRELPLKEEIPWRLLTPEEMQSELKKSLEEDLASEDLDASEKVLRFLGLYEGSKDLKQTLSELLEEQVYGFYDQETKELAVLQKSQKITAMERMALVHEIVHGLQDQNFDLSNYMPPKLEGDDDSLTAAQCLYEGDASWTSLLYVQKNFNPLSDLGLALESFQASGNQIKDVPPYLVESLLFPYQEGLAFVRYLYEQGGFDSVNEAFLHPPSSSEQIIHPEKYLAKEEPQDIIFPLPYALSDWTTVRQNTLGEFDFRFLFREVLSEEEALNASAGWAGSHYLYAEKGTDKAFILVSQWDSVKDAQEAYFGLEAYLKGRFSFAPENYGQGSLYTGENEAAIIYPEKTKIYLIFAPSGGMSKDLLEGLP